MSALLFNVTTLVQYLCKIMIHTNLEIEICQKRHVEDHYCPLIWKTSASQENSLLNDLSISIWMSGSLWTSFLLRRYLQTVKMSTIVYCILFKVWLIVYGPCGLHALYFNTETIPNSYLLRNTISKGSKDHWKAVFSSYSIGNILVHFWNNYQCCLSISEWEKTPEVYLNSLENNKNRNGAKQYLF